MLWKEVRDGFCYFLLLSASATYKQEVELDKDEGTFALGDDKALQPGVRGLSARHIDIIKGRRHHAADRLNLH